MQDSLGLAKEMRRLREAEKRTVAAIKRQHRLEDARLIRPASVQAPVAALGAPRERRETPTRKTGDSGESGDDPEPPPSRGLSGRRDIERWIAERKAALTALVLLSQPRPDTTPPLCAKTPRRKEARQLSLFKFEEVE
jgi:hypothetical protein